MLRTVFTILSFVLLQAGYAAAQENVPERYLEVRGTSELEMEPLARATANLYEGTVNVKSVQTGADGSFSFRLDINKQYVIEIEKEGLISKRISFNTQMPDEEKGSWMNEFSIGLIKPCNGVDYSVLKEPVDRVAFDAKKREFVSDKDYVNKLRSRIEALLIKNDQCMLDTYEALVKKADQTAIQKNYQEAINTYREALKIYPREEYPAKRIAEINAQINRQQNASEAYQKTIAEADALAAQQSFTEALAKYKQAAALNPQETYPKQKVTEIESSLARQKTEKQALLSQEERYNQAMAKASVAYTKKDYATAQQYYQEALTIKPAESLPKTRVQEIETILAKKASENAARANELAQKAAFEKEYTSLVAQADEQFKAKKYEEARASYSKAMTMKPAESYPAQRVKTIDNAVAAEQTAQQRNKDDVYNAAMTAANNALAKNQFPQAKEFIQKALSIKPEDVAARNRLAEANRMEAEYTKRKSLDEQYAGLIQTADGQLAKKEYSQAKASFMQAMSVKPSDAYAQTRITAIDNLVAAEQAALQKNQQEAYQAALTAGNNALAQNQFTQAKESFQKALSVKPNDAYAKNRIAETERLSVEYGKQKVIDDEYRKFVQSADSYWAAKDLVKARESYVQALSIKPGDSYAQTKIYAIDNTFAAEQAAKVKSIEDSYKAAIGAANTAITQKTYPLAKDYLQKALTIKPGDAYATGKSAEIDRLMQEQQKRIEQEQLMAKQYSEIIAAADKLFNTKDYNNAKVSYSRAIQLKPGDPYSLQKIAALENILLTEQANQQKKVETDYKNAMDHGSAALLTKDYKSALQNFQQALAVKPTDTHAKSKISETELLIKQEQERILAEQARKKKYDELIRSADLFFGQKNFASAKTNYEQALEILPGETYPRQKLQEAANAIAEQEKLMAENKARETAYNLALVNADKFFKAKDYSQARDEYGRALALKPGEAFPKSKIAEMDNLIMIRQREQDEAKAKANAYTTAINAGNAAFNGKEYANARTAYTEALKHMPGDLLATDQIKKIDYLQAEAEKIKKAEQDRKATYDRFIASADKAYEAGTYALAKEDYKKALVVEPNSAYAKQRIARIDEISRTLAQTPVKTPQQSQNTTSQRVSAAIPMGELNFKNESERQLYLDDLKRKYPSGITLEKYKEQFKETYRYIIIRENLAQEFRHVKYTTYSGAQYSVNGKPITQQYFLSQTKTRVGESYKEIDMQ